MRRGTFKEKKITNRDGLELYYEVSGNTKNVLFFVHGLGGDVAAWDEERVYFEQMGYSTIALDLRAHGYSEHPSSRDGYNIEAFAHDIHDVVEAENIRNFVLIGHCFGGMVVYTYERLYPNVAAALILVDTSYRAPYLSEHNLLKKLVHTPIRYIARISPGFYSPRHVDYTTKGYEHDFEPFGLFGVIKHNSLKTFLSVSDVVFSLNVFDNLEKIRLPTFIIVGTNDTIYPPKMSEEIHKRIKGSQLEYVETANHPIVLNYPMELSTAMHRFIEKINF
jgi:pimeloyl-ACP methyl ester carboxylesterase